jgi:hypothetical protein
VFLFSYSFPIHTFIIPLDTLPLLALGTSFSLDTPSGRCFLVFAFLSLIINAPLLKSISMIPCPFKKCHYDTIGSPSKGPVLQKKLFWLKTNKSPPQVYTLLMLFCSDHRMAGLGKHLKKQQAKSPLKKVKNVVFP